MSESKAISLLDTESLSNTIDNINNAHFLNLAISKAEARHNIEWISGRINTPHSYAGSFGLTDKDMFNTTRTFTGEIVSSTASKRHIHAEEASRALHILNKTARQQIPSLEVSDSLLLGRIHESEMKGKPRGTFCCGPCTVSLWRHLAVGGMGSYQSALNTGLKVLKQYHDINGEWKRFPFYYTVSALVELTGYSDAISELRFIRSACEKRIKKLKNSTTYGNRKLKLMQMVLAMN